MCLRRQLHKLRGGAKIAIMAYRGPLREDDEWGYQDKIVSIPPKYPHRP
jgi:hypothetical protein